MRSDVNLFLWNDPDIRFRSAKIDPSPYSPGDRFYVRFNADAGDLTLYMTPAQLEDLTRATLAGLVVSRGWPAEAAEKFAAVVLTQDLEVASVTAKGIAEPDPDDPGPVPEPDPDSTAGGAPFATVDPSTGDINEPI